MSLKDSTTTSDYIDFDIIQAVAKKLIKENKNIAVANYIIIASNTGLRCSDVLQLTYEKLQEETIKITEGKTDKKKVIALNQAICDIVPADAVGSPFLTQKGSVITIQHLNRLLKEVFKKESKILNISSHTCRKSFGRRVWNNDNQSERSLIYLMELFNHSTLTMTKKYLGIRQEELNDIYHNL